MDHVDPVFQSIEQEMLEHSSDCVLTTGYRASPYATLSPLSLSPVVCT